MAPSCPLCHMRMAPPPQLLVGASGYENTEVPAAVGQEMGLSSLPAALAKVTDGSWGGGWAMGGGGGNSPPPSLPHSGPLSPGHQSIAFTLYPSEAHGRRVASACFLCQQLPHHTPPPLAPAQCWHTSPLTRPNLQVPSPCLHLCPMRLC